MTLVKFNPEKKNSSLLPGFNDIFESALADTFFFRTPHGHRSCR